MADPYASHLPVLRVLNRVLPILHAFEFGCGPASTPAFLDRQNFPSLAKLYSFESNPYWHGWARAQHGGDPRLVSVLCPEAEALRRFPHPADVAFVDGAAAEWRVPTVNACRRLAQLVVLHDAENQIYSQALTGWKFSYIYKAMCPWTAVLSDTINLDRLEALLNGPAQTEGGRL